MKAESTKYRFKEMAVGETWLCEAGLRDGFKKRQALDAAKTFYRAKGVHFTIKDVAKGFLCTVTRNDLFMVDSTNEKIEAKQKQKKEKKPRSPDADVKYFFRAALLNASIMNEPGTALHHARVVTDLYRQTVYGEPTQEEEHTLT